jgi:hypothetical protein
MGCGEDIASIGAGVNRWRVPMQTLNDLSRSLPSIRTARCSGFHPPGSLESLVLALLRSADRLWDCLLIGVDRRSTAWQVTRLTRGGGHCAVHRAACAVWAGAFLRQCRAASISASVAPLLRAHASAVEAVYLAT